MTHPQTATSAKPEILELDKPTWHEAAKRSNIPLIQWAINSLDSTVNEQDAERVDLLDDIDFYIMSDGQTPMPFQVAAMRHWVGLTQTKAANLISTRLSTYRNCESTDECVLMDSDRWGLYVEKATNNLLDIEYSTLPNAFGRSMRGLSGLTYRQLNDVSNLSQSYWTTRLRFKYPPAPIEIESIDELIKIVIKVINTKIKTGLFREAKAMLKSLLYFAYETQKARVMLNTDLISPMHTIKKLIEENVDPEIASTASKNSKQQGINGINLYARTIEILAEHGFFFSPQHKSIAFIES